MCEHYTSTTSTTVTTRTEYRNTCHHQPRPIQRQRASVGTPWGAVVVVAGATLIGAAVITTVAVAIAAVCVAVVVVPIYLGAREYAAIERNARAQAVSSTSRQVIEGRVVGGVHRASGQRRPQAQRVR